MNKAIEWFSENNMILAISTTGEVTALATGTANIYAKSSGIKSNTITIAVAQGVDPNATASVVITSPKVSLITGESLQLGVIVKNAAGQMLNGKTIEWISGNSGVVIVSNNGNITATGIGSANIYARSEGIISNTVTISVSMPGVSRTGIFVKAGGYEAAGTATLSTQGGELILDLGADFKTSFALGTFIYLSNSTNASTVKATAFEVSQITTNGAKKFNISKLKSSIQITDYKYVVILCKPASVTFGYAELK